MKKMSPNSVFREVRKDKSISHEKTFKKSQQYIFPTTQGRHRLLEKIAHAANIKCFSINYFKNIQKVFRMPHRFCGNEGATGISVKYWLHSTCSLTHSQIRWWQSNALGLLFFSWNNSEC